MEPIDRSKPAGANTIISNNPTGGVRPSVTPEQALLLAEATDSAMLFLKNQQTLSTAQRDTLVNDLRASAVYQTLSKPVQQQLLQPEQQMLLLQQLQNQATKVQLGHTVLTVTAEQRSALISLLLPLVKYYAQATPFNQLSLSAQTAPQQRPAQLPELTADSLHKTATPLPTPSEQRPLSETAAPSLSMTNRLKEAAAAIKEDVLKALNLDKTPASGATTTAANLKLQADTWYFAKLLPAEGKQGQLLLQTTRGELRLVFNTLPPLPTAVPLQLRVNQPNADTLELQFKQLSQAPLLLQLSPQQTKLLQDPQLITQLQHSILRGETQVKLAGEILKLPQLDAKAIQLTLLPVTNNNVKHSTDNPAGQLSIHAVSGEQKIRLPLSELLTPLTLSNAPTARSLITPLSAESRDLAWRQLLPLLTPSPALLRSLPDMPAAAQLLLGTLRQAQPDGAKVLSAPQVIEHLQAALQFHPLQTQANLSTAAGTLAVAIQLLLGQLLRQPAATGKEPVTQRLVQSISQLDPQQSGQLLRALGSHSSALQLAQLQNADSANVGQQWLIPLALQQQQESRLSQILIEQREAERKEDAAPQRCWQLTMKFDLGRFGQLMAVAKLTGSELQLQFYTDDPSALRQAEKFLPLLTERCTAQGLSISHAQCQLGKIPDTLGNRRTSLISTKA